MHVFSKLDLALQAVDEKERRLNQHIVVVGALVGSTVAHIIGQKVLAEMGYNLGMSRTIVAILQVLALS